MSFYADLHVHSRYSRATSKQCTLGWFNYWAQLKGVTVVGTGDFTHPEWFKHLTDNLEETGTGLYKVAPGAAQVKESVPAACVGEVLFVPTAEISSIYKRGGAVRKVHSVIVAPDLVVAEKIQAALGRIGNIHSDGRPILGLDPRDLLAIVLEASARAFLVPAHIWTPWFSMLGSKSGFDSAEECFGDDVKHIFAVETGLSSDPPMNWRVTDLDRFSLVSNSDAHSPENLARECNVFHCMPTYDNIRDALQSGDPAQYGGTLEFFPEEGKYHLDGHRACACRLMPAETRGHHGVCPVCGKAVTVGVLSRVEELADRPEGVRPARGHDFQRLVGLAEILGEIFGVGSASKKVMNEYHRLLQRFGPEVRILRESDPEQLASVSGPLLGEAIRRMRAGQVYTEGGYDGEYGVIRVFAPGERDDLAQPRTLVSVARETPKASRAPAAVPAVCEPAPLLALAEPEAAYRAVVAGSVPEEREAQASSGPQDILAGLDAPQRAAVEHVHGSALISAGPGTGKTNVLTRRMALIVARGLARPEQMLAVTFTNAAADEMRERLARLAGESAAAMTFCTCHALGLRLLREDGGAVGVSPDARVLDERSREELLAELFPQHNARDRRAMADRISRQKQLEQGCGDVFSEFERYEAALRSRAAVDFDDLNAKAAQLLMQDAAVREKWQRRFAFISVDEFQDINHWQYVLVRQLAPAGANICVIGDPRQAIYGFRGADWHYFERFAQDYPGCAVFQLTHNYRSSRVIVHAANDLAGEGRIQLTADGSDDGPRIVLYTAATEQAEAEFVAHQIEQVMGGTSFFSMDSARVASAAEARASSFSEIAVLYRLNAQAAPIETALARLGVPYQTVGAASPWSLPGLERLLERLREIAHQRGDARARDALAPVCAAYCDELPAGRERDVCGMLARRAAASVLPARAFFDELLLLTSLDAYDPRAERVSLLSIHAAKGREFAIVFLVGCEDGLLPYERAEAVDEEQRLFYVALTRARRLLCCSHARRRWLFGETRAAAASPFLEHLRAALLDRQQQDVKRRTAQMELGLGG